MRIAITTWFGGFNAGTFFQLYGLYKYLENRGHSVKVVNYKSQKSDFLPKGVKYYFSQLLPLVKKKIDGFVERQNMNKLKVRFKDDFSLREKRFNELYKELSFTERVCTTEDFEGLNDQFDLFMVGSDQVWNATMLNRRYLLDYVNKDKMKAAYGPSVGTAVIYERQKKEYKKYLSDFNYVAVREEKLQNCLNELLPVNVEHSLDPSMLISAEEYLQMANYPLNIEKGSYLLCYFTPNNEEEELLIKKYASRKGLKVVIMTMHSYTYNVDGVIKYTTAGPREFLGLIANAACVITSSFHCTIFSILFHKELFVIERKSKGKSTDTSLRYREQLGAYGMLDRLIRDFDVDAMVNCEKIDYDKVEQIFQTKVKKSCDFLNQFC